jgi:hypothetical protein
MQDTPERQATRLRPPQMARVVVRRTSMARLLATAYRQAAPPLRARLLTTLLQPVGPLALVAIGAGAFARLLPTSRWQAVQVRADDALQIQAQQVLDLVHYVEQKSPELLWQLPQLLPDSALWLGSAAGAVLLLLLRARQRR